MLLLLLPVPLTVGLMIAGGRKKRPVLRWWAYGLTALAAAGAILAAFYYGSLPEGERLFGYFVETVACFVAAWVYGILLVLFCAAGYCRRVKEQTENNV